MTAPTPKLRWFQYRLRTLLVVVTLCAIPCSWLAVKMRQAEREREAAAAIEALDVEIVWSKPSGPAWLRSLLGDLFFTHVESVDFASKRGLALVLFHDRQTKDAGLESFTWVDPPPPGLEGAEWVNRLQTLLKSLNGLNQLRKLNLDFTEITDAGLEQLAGLNQLQELSLKRTDVTDEGVRKLQQALPNCQILR